MLHHYKQAIHYITGTIVTHNFNQRESLKEISGACINHFNINQKRDLTMDKQEFVYIYMYL